MHTIQPGEDIPYIAPSLNTVHSTISEGLSITACFGLAASAACAGTYLISKSSELNPVYLAFLIASTALYNINRAWFEKNLIEAGARPNAVGEDHKKFEQLKKIAEVYAKKMGMSRTPELSITNMDQGAPAISAGVFKKKHVAFQETYLRRASLGYLESLLGHEMAHIQQKHSALRLTLRILRKISLVQLIISPFVLHSLLGEVGIISSFVINSAMCRATARRQEFQADRIGAVVSGKGKYLIKQLFQLDATVPILYNFKTVTYPKKGREIAKLIIPTIAYFYGYLMKDDHPAPERRIARLASMDNPPSRYQHDKCRTRIMRPYIESRL